MGKRGRPRKNGFQPVWMFLRANVVIYAYDEARSSGLKHSSAVKEAVATVNKVYPGMPISETEVKRVLAKFQPKGVAEAFKVTRTSEQSLPPAMTGLIGVLQDSRKKTIFGIWFRAETRISPHLVPESGKRARS